MWFNARDFIEAVLASGEEARPLGIPANAPLVRIEGVPLSASGESDEILRLLSLLFLGPAVGLTARDVVADVRRRSGDDGGAGDAAKKSWKQLRLNFLL